MAVTAPPVLAMDIGGTKLAVGIVTGDGNTHGLLVEPTYRNQGPEAVIERLFQMGHRSLAAADLDWQVEAIGISCGGPLDAPRGVLLCPPHLPGWIDVPIGPLAAAEFALPFGLENDGTAAALAEHRFGAGRGVSTMLYLTVSTGVGGGAVVAGRLHSGAAGNGGEFGHVIVHRGGRLCSCGRHGCVEAYASGTAIADQAAEALAAGRDSSLRAVSTPTAADVARAAREGDPVASEVWACAVDALGSAVTDLVNVYEPDLVVLGGGVTRAGSQLLDPVREQVAHEAMGPAGQAARIELAALGDVVCVVGAGVVGRDYVSAAKDV